MGGTEPETASAVPEVKPVVEEAVGGKEGAAMEEEEEAPAGEDNADEAPLVSEKDPGDDDTDAAEEEKEEKEAQEAEQEEKAREEKEKEEKEKEGEEEGGEGGNAAKSGMEEERKKLLAMPPHGSEVFVGGVTKETTEEELKELCSTVGEVFEV